MADAVSLSAASFGVVETFLRADWVVKGVMLGLACASLWSWAVILDRAFRIGGAQREADRFENEVASGRSLDDLAKAAGEAPGHALPIMLQAALREWRDARAKPHLTDTEISLVLQRVDRALDAVVTRETGRLENGLGVLAIVATASPFIGLFGTVWGVYHALVAIGMTGSGQLDKVAGPVGEALIMTGIGLAVALPAVMGYNWLTRSNRVLTAKLDAFAFELLTFLSMGRSLQGDAGRRPPVPGAAPAVTLSAVK